MILPFIYWFTIFAVNILYFVSLNPIGKFLPTPELYSNLFINLIFFGLIMGLQDKMYENWRGNKVVLKMTVLILVGATVAFFTNLVLYKQNPSIGHAIAISGFVAFAVGRLADLFVYHVFRKRSITASICLSNTTSGMLDPILFFMTSLLFGYHWDAAIPLFPSLVIGGILWSFLLIKGRVLG